MVKMELARIIISETSEEQVIFLREVEGSRWFPIVIGIWEALSIDRGIKGRQTPRPMTHDLLGNVIRDLDGRLERVVITALKERTFFANLIIRRNGELMEVDSRPSDAIALAVLLKAPIFVSEQVLRDAGQMAPPESAPAGEAAEGLEEEPGAPDDGGEEPEPEGEDEGFV